MDIDAKCALGEQAYVKALKYELDYGCCLQCVLATVQETIGIIDDQTVKASHGLSGGGGLLALSAKYGCDRDKLDSGRYINNFKKAKELTERFRAEFGGVTCQQLQQQFTGRTYDMLNAEEYKAFDTARGNKCAHATRTVTKWVVESMG